MNLDVYLNFRGNCEEAFRFYERELGARVTSLQRHDELPIPGNTPPEWGPKVLHARLELGGMVVMGADIPNAEPMRSAYLSLRVDSDAEADRIYALLSEGGEIFMKMAETFFASRFAMLRDRFGVSWMLMKERNG
jgi:PhnB protein